MLALRKHKVLTAEHSVGPGPGTDDWLLAIAYRTPQKQKRLSQPIAVNLKTSHRHLQYNSTTQRDQPMIRASRQSCSCGGELSRREAKLISGFAVTSTASTPTCHSQRHTAYCADCMTMSRVRSALDLAAVSSLGPRPSHPCFPLLFYSTVSPESLHITRY